MNKKYDDPDFCGMQVFGRTFQMTEFSVFLINLLLTITPFGLFAKRNFNNGKVDRFATWFMRAVSAACCYYWYSLFGFYHN